MRIGFTEKEEGVASRLKWPTRLEEPNFDTVEFALHFMGKKSSMDYLDEQLDWIHVLEITSAGSGEDGPDHGELRRRRSWVGVTPFGMSGR